MAEIIGIINRAVVTNTAQIGDKIGQCEGNITKIAKLAVYANVNPSQGNCSACLLAPFCSESWTEMKIK